MLFRSPLAQVLVDTLPVLLAAMADLNPDPKGACQELSVVMQMGGVGAFVFDD